MKHDELSLDHAFWQQISTNRAFFDFFVSRSKFTGKWLDLDLHEKWHQRWFRDPISRLDSETDITLFLDETRLNQKYAIHIENKPAHGKWQPNQPDNYAIRAENRMRAWKHDDYETAIIAPSRFIEAHKSEVEKFGFFVTYEDLSAFIPQFNES